MPSLSMPDVPQAEFDEMVRALAEEFGYRDLVPNPAAEGDFAQPQGIPNPQPPADFVAARVWQDWVLDRYLNLAGRRKAREVEAQEKERLRGRFAQPAG